MSEKIITLQSKKPYGVVTTEETATLIYDLENPLVLKIVTFSSFKEWEVSLELLKEGFVKYSGIGHVSVHCPRFKKHKTVEIRFSDVVLFIIDKYVLYNFIQELSFEESMTSLIVASDLEEELQKISFGKI